jgi:putative N6-adenine-specific DNA methylase
VKLPAKSVIITAFNILSTRIKIGKKNMIKLTATAAFGLEAVVKKELEKLGYDQIVVENGRLTFPALLKDICRTNLWLRSADRVLLQMDSFTAMSFEALFEKTKALPWEEWLPADACFPVEGKSIKSKLFSVPDCQAIVKKAIVERLKTRYKLDWFPETGPRYRIEVALYCDVATISIDTSGAGLHKRGYRKLNAEAPLKETMAAAMILLSYWQGERPLLDPCCGSGTIPIEAAMIARNIAPGINRSFASEKWPSLPTDLWEKAREEAVNLQKILPAPLEITGQDIDQEAVSLAAYHVTSLGLGKDIIVKCLPCSETTITSPYGCLITNPPYGERIGERDATEQLYHQMGALAKKNPTWSFYVLTSNQDFQHIFGKRADRRRKLFNGGIECQYYQYNGPRPPREERKANIG